MEPTVPASKTPRGLTAFGIFLIFGTCMASLAAATLSWPGTALDLAWKLNPQGKVRLLPLGPAVGILFLALALALGSAAVGWFRRRRWGWLLATIIISTQVLGDLVNAATGQFWEGVFGAAIAGAFLYYLLQPSVRSAFTKTP